MDVHEHVDTASPVKMNKTEQSNVVPLKLALLVVESKEMSKDAPLLANCALVILGAGATAVELRMRTVVDVLVNWDALVLDVFNTIL